MPTYEYACRQCGEHLEVVQSFKDDSLTECPACKGELRKVFSAAGIIFKGSGWHIKDYASSSKGGSSSNGSSSDSSSSSSSGNSKDSGSKDSGSKDSGSTSAGSKGSDGVGKGGSSTSTSSSSSSTAGSGAKDGKKSA